MREFGSKNAGTKARAWGALTLAVASTLLTGCSQTLDASVCKDGTYEGQSQPAPDGQHAVIKFTVKGKKVTTAKFTVIDEKGRPHDGEYGKTATGDTGGKFYQRAQRAVGAEPQYAQKFVETSDAAKVDTIAGASISHGLFQDAVADALGKCR